MVEQAGNTGIVYILSNVAMPGYLKIGQTSGDSPEDVVRRMGELYRATGVPRPFNCEYAAVVADPHEVEQKLLYGLGDFRVNPNREFLEGIDPIRVKKLLQLSAIIEEVTPGETGVGYAEPATHDKPPKAERFTFQMVGIPVGETLEWADDPEKKCRVLDGRTHVEYEGDTYSLYPLSAHLKGWSNAQGSKYWLYEGETLQERRNRLESSGDDGD